MSDVRHDLQQAAMLFASARRNGNRGNVDMLYCHAIRYVLELLDEHKISDGVTARAFLQESRDYFQASARRHR